MMSPGHERVRRKRKTLDVQIENSFKLSGTLMELLLRMIHTPAKILIEFRFGEVPVVRNRGVTWNCPHTHF